ncbi:hypothetical protein [Campylobacter sp. RM12647]|uniref:hypothetical protein n=1 Tax=Campylobacter sp. RM12647 TaxID=2735737 RepID=UPI001DE3F9DC|nr:hypothetical protein [Campylobacter sp. RM12647]
MEFILLHIIVLITFFIVLIKPKGFKRKLMWFAIWFFAFFGDIFITNIVFYYNANKYATNTYLETFKGNSLYIGEYKVNLMDKERYKISEYYIGGWIGSILPDFYMRSLLDNKIKYIEYKEISDHPINNGKYFRFYSSNEDDKNCMVSKDLEYKLLFTLEYDRSDGTKGFIEYEEFLELYNKYYKKYLAGNSNVFWEDYLRKNMFHEKIPTEIKDLIKYLIQKHNMPEDRIRYLIIDMMEAYRKKSVKIEEFYKGKCIARVEIDKNELSRYEYVKCTNSDYEYICDYPDIKDKLWTKFEYFAYIKDRINNKKIAQSILAYKTGTPFSLYTIIATATSPFYTSGARASETCSKNISVRGGEECNDIFIDNFINNNEMKNK